VSAPPPPDSTAVLRSLHARFGMASEVNVTVLAVLACDRARVQELLKSRCYGVMVIIWGSAKTAVRTAARPFCARPCFDFALERVGDPTVREERTPSRRCC